MPTTIQPPSAVAPSPGVGVDSRGGAVIDPTANVIALSEASAKRQDDLRAADNRRQMDAIAHVKELNALRCAYIEKLANLRETHQEKMDAAESGRINSMRQVDVLATAATAAQALTAVQTLAASTTAIAERLSASMNSTMAEFNKRVSALEQSSYEGVGKQKVADPHHDRLATMVEQLVLAQSNNAGKNAGISTSWAILLGVMSLIGVIVAMAGVVAVVLKN